MIEKICFHLDWRTYILLLKNDWKKNPWNNGILLLFITLAAAISVTVTLMLTQLFTSISSMYETANPPHFLQMHKGELHQSDLDEFNRGYKGIRHWQTVPMITICGDEIMVLGKDGNQFSLADCRLDISLVKQNENYDVLLDENRKPLVMHSGEIGVPVILLDEFDIAIGDTITLCNGRLTKNFTVSAYVCDGQMNSTLCSSTRFLVSDADFETLQGNVGETEYLIEAWFADSAQASDYQTAYEESGKNLPKNGQAITYTMIFLLSALTDLLTAVVFLLAGALLIVIALVCLRYAVLAELEDDMREIGTMKAMGIPAKGIRELYLGKIRILTALGCICGFLFGKFCALVLTGHIGRTFGSQPPGAMGLILSMLAAALVYGIILLFSRQILHRLGKVTVIDLLVTEVGFGRKAKVKVKDGLRRSKRLPVNLLWGLHEAQNGYGIIFGLLLIVSLLVTIPLRTVQTIKEDEFVTYMGFGMCDLLLEVEQGGDVEKRNQTAASLLQTAAERGVVEHMDVLRRVRLQAVREDGKAVGIHIDTGENAGMGLKYLEGENPKTESQIVLSYLMAEELGKTVGDTLKIRAGGETQTFTVNGIYQDVTSGGRTAKTARAFPSETAEKYSYKITLSPAASDDFAVDLREQLGRGYSVENMEEFLFQTMGGVTAQVQKAGIIVMLIGICLAALITALFLKLRFVRAVPAFAVKRVMGVPFSAVQVQELIPILAAGGFGSVCGTLFSELFGDRLVSGLLGMLGVGLKNIVFAEAPIWQYFTVPAVLLATLSIVTIGFCTQIKNLDIADCINE